MNILKNVTFKRDLAAAAACSVEYKVIEGGALLRDSEGRSLQIQDLYSRKNCLDHFLNHHGDVPEPELAEVISSIIMEMTSASSGSGTVRAAVSASRTVTASGGV